jgi:NAD(P)-dependent dehydrogenase (short-subunit alcohol dehydrogenase family)
MHVLVANSGLRKDAAVADMTLDDWRTVIDINLTGQFLCCREAVRLFRKQAVARDWILPNGQARVEVLAVAAARNAPPTFCLINHIVILIISTITESTNLLVRPKEGPRRFTCSGPSSSEHGGPDRGRGSGLATSLADTKHRLNPRLVCPPAAPSHLPPRSGRVAREFATGTNPA